MQKGNLNLCGNLWLINFTICQLSAWGLATLGMRKHKAHLRDTFWGCRGISAGPVDVPLSSFARFNLELCLLFDDSEQNWSEPQRGPARRKVNFRRCAFIRIILLGQRLGDSEVDIPEGTETHHYSKWYCQRFVVSSYYRLVLSMYSGIFENRPIKTITSNCANITASVPSLHTQQRINFH